MLNLYQKLSITLFKNKFQQKQLALYKSYASAQSGNPDQSWTFSCLPFITLYFRFLGMDHAKSESCYSFVLFVCLIWFFTSHQQSFSYKGTVFLGWTSTKLGLMFLLKDTTQWRRWGSNPRPFGLESSTLPLSHCAPYHAIVTIF